MTTQYAGADWIAKALRVEPSAFGVQVADMLGDWQAGIYHMDTDKLAKADWTHEKYIAVVHWGRLSTFDDESLTRLVILAHERCIRTEISGRANGYLLLSFSPRQRDGRYWERHSTIEEAVTNIRHYYRETVTR